MRSKRISLTPAKLAEIEKSVNETVLGLRLSQLRGNFYGLNERGRDDVIVSCLKDIYPNVLEVLMK